MVHFAHAGFGFHATEAFLVIFLNNYAYDLDDSISNIIHLKPSVSFIVFFHFKFTVSETTYPSVDILLTHHSSFSKILRFYLSAL